MRHYFTLFLAMVFHWTLLAQDGSHDLTFNPTDIGFEYGDGPFNTLVNPNTHIQRIAVQPDGKILAAGLFAKYNGHPCKTIIRLTAEGDIDPTFNIPGDGLGGEVFSILIQADGKILLGGYFSEYDTTPVTNVIRLHTDGSLDTSFVFNAISGNARWIQTMVMQPDGKIVLGGNQSMDHIIRINSDGSLDATFESPYVFGIYTLGLQSDGKIIAGGNFTMAGEATAKRMLRLNTDGTLDNTFDMSVGFDALVRRLVVLPDNKIVVIGAFGNFNGEYKPRILKLTANGVLDTSFSPGNFNNDIWDAPELSVIRLQPDGKLVIGGKFKLHGASPVVVNQTAAGNIIRLNANGTRDTSFDATGANAQLYDFALQSDGKIVTGGLFDSYDDVARRRISRALPNGAIDMTFNTGTGANSAVYDLKVLPDGKIMIAGDFRLYNGAVRNRIARLNADGTVDASLTSNLLIDGPIGKFKIQPDGKIIIMGAFTKVGGSDRGRIARLNANLTLDNTFTVGTGFPSTALVNDIALQPDGKIIAVGYFTSYNGTTCNRVVRLNANGTIDTSFNIGTAASDTVLSVFVQADGKVVLCGAFYTFNGVAKKGIVRLNADGSIDPTFITGTGLFGNAGNIAQTADGKLLIGGNLDTYNGVSVYPLIRLNTDGTLDNTFSYFGGDNGIASILVLPDGNILVTGSFYEDPWDLKNVIKLSPSGVIDNNFDVNQGTGANSGVGAADIQSDGKIVIAGGFVAVDGVGRNRIARLNNTAPLQVSAFSKEAEKVIVYTENNQLWIAAKDAPLKKIYVYDLNGRLLCEQQNRTDSKFAIQSIKPQNQTLILKCVDSQGKESNLKTIF